MPSAELSLAIANLTATEPDHYAVWVLHAPYPGGYVLHDRIWPKSLTHLWQTWRSMFSISDAADFPQVLSSDVMPLAAEESASNTEKSYAGRLMQHLGINLWQWLFDGAIESSLAKSQGIAIGQSKPLRLRLEIRDPELIALPWEIMQAQVGTQAIALGQQILFSRTTSAVDPLPKLRTEHSLRILIVLGQETESTLGLPDKPVLQLEQEAETLARTFEQASVAEPNNYFNPPVPCEVKVLVKPTPAELVSQLEMGNFNVLFYSGHGVPDADGGQLFLRPDAVINGTELAQVLTRCQVKLAVFNACWGAQPDYQNGQAIPRSSLAEVLIHHGVPAVLGMRDTISDEEAISFIQVFARSLAERLSIDEAVAIGRQHLLTVYKFNYPAWTLPVLYMHPEFDGELIKPLTDGVTEIPDNSPSWLDRQIPAAYLRSLTPPIQTWPIYGGIMRIGCIDGNDLVLRVPGVSKNHAEILYRDSLPDNDADPSYVLRDFSRYGTSILGTDGRWHKVHQREIPLPPRATIRFGNVQVEFLVDG